MKRRINVLIPILFMVVMTGCKNKQEETTFGKTLIAYFSMPESDDADNMTEDEANSTVIVEGEVLGNTQFVATVIQDTTKADIFRIEASNPYPTQHESLVEIAKQEQNDKASVEIKNSVENIDQYDTIFIGYPIWWSDLPRIVYSFFDTYELADKTIIPFSTHGGSGWGASIDTIVELEPDAKVIKEGFSVSRNDVEDAKKDIISWLKGVELK